MATLDTRRQTHRRVLPQPAALESASADTPGAGTKRGADAAAAAAPGVDRDVREFAPARAARILARAKAPLRDAAAAQSTRWALWRALDERLPTHVGTGGRTKWNRSRNRLPKSHTLDAIAVGKADTITETVDSVLVAGCAGRGSYARTRPDRCGFPRLRLPRTKGFFGFATGDLVRAAVPTGRKAGTHTGRVAVRATGRFNITTGAGTIQGIGHRHVRLLQRADGYAYTTRPEQPASSAADRASAPGADPRPMSHSVGSLIPHRPEGRSLIGENR